MSAIRDRTAALVVEIDSAELAVRIGEAMMGVKRPEGATAVETLDGTEPDVRAMLMEGAAAAAGFLLECVNAGKVPS